MDKLTVSMATAGSQTLMATLAEEGATSALLWRPLTWTVSVGAQKGGTVFLCACTWPCAQSSSAICSRELMAASLLPC